MLSCLDYVLDLVIGQELGGGKFDVVADRGKKGTLLIKKIVPERSTHFFMSMTSIGKLM